jgi:cytochrome c-type biogenesis protein CcsB
MKKFLNVLFSFRLMAIIIAVFGISIAIATFIENDFGTPSARAVVYNSWWFEVLLLAGIANLTGVIFINKLYKKEKISIFLFHISFLFILLGSAVTHFFGFEGFMHIREGGSSDQLISSNVFLSATATENGQKAHAEKPVFFSSLTDNYKQLKLRLPDKVAKVECVQFIPDASETLVDEPGGKPVIELIIAGINGKQSILLSEKFPRKIGEMLFSLNDTTNVDGVNIVYNHDGLQFKSNTRVLAMNMMNQKLDTLLDKEYHPFLLKTLYNFGGTQIVAKNFSPSAKIDVATTKGVKSDELSDALRLKLSCGSQSTTILYFATHNALNNPVDVKLGNVSLSVSFGAKIVKLPFVLQLKKFILEHYPGSNSPSWFESKILLTDDKNNVKGDYRIFMNNVMKYNGYRFFQSSYDTDEQGTILSVTYDFWGTFITYFGYLLLTMGMVLSLFNKNSHFRKLSGELSKIRNPGKISTLVLMLIFSATLGASAQKTLPDSVFINKQQASKFGEMLVQDPGGRIKPLNTLSSELLRKISRKTKFMGQTSDQILLGMLVYPEFWQNIPMIKVSHPEIQKILQTKNGYSSFLGFFKPSTPQHEYLISKYVEEAYQRKPALRNQFDTEIIRLDERLNLCYQIYTGTLIRIFPKSGDMNQTWYTPVNVGTVFKGKDSLYITEIIPLYFQSIKVSSKTENWKSTDEVLEALKHFQKKSGNNLMPSAFKVKMEILYNRANVFGHIGSLYGLVGFLLLLFQFLGFFLPRMNLKPITGIAAGIIILGFIAHFAGLALRWYVSGHAPWSNAYESLIYIAFATMLAGIIFAKRSGITLSATALLAWLILFVAHLNWMDPEITNLVPVLKSYWLLIHVAIITGSYGFMALGALLALINLILMIFQSGKNYIITRNLIRELSMVIEMTLIIGLYMLTIGMFLGGVWANESWGKYWGWDPKETWALVSVLVYAFIVHARMIPGLKGEYAFNLMSLLGFGSIIMTYFGVNYYLSGLHSYAKGDPLPVPSFVYYSVGIVIVIVILAWLNHGKKATVKAR